MEKSKILEILKKSNKSKPTYKKHKDIVAEVMSIYDPYKSNSDRYRLSLPVLTVFKGATSILMLLEVNTNGKDFKPVQWVLYPIKKKKIILVETIELGRLTGVEIPSDEILPLPELTKKTQEAYTELELIGNEMVNQSLNGTINVIEYNLYLHQVIIFMTSNKINFYKHFKYIDPMNPNKSMD